MNEPTTAEAIVWFERRKAGAAMPGANAMYDKAIAALRAQQEKEKNDPLTLDELREIGQRCEGIYVANIDGTPVFRGQKYCVAILDFSPAFGSMAEMHIHAIYGDKLTLSEDEYGKTWLAYRRKPEEEIK